jgi:hypothetical protein
VREEIEDIEVDNDDADGGNLTETEQAVVVAVPSVMLY